LQIQLAGAVGYVDVHGRQTARTVDDPDTVGEGKVRGDGAHRRRLSLDSAAIE
jgi:hypothetical protein